MFFQQVTSVLLCYVCEVDPKMLMALSTIASSQATPTENTLEMTLYFLNYVTSHPGAILTFKASGAVLNIAQIICNVIPSATATEIGALFVNIHLSIPVQNLLI